LSLWSSIGVIIEHLGYGFGQGKPIPIVNERLVDQIFKEKGFLVEADRMKMLPHGCSKIPSTEKSG
jgi:hypothetical protein